MLPLFDRVKQVQRFQLFSPLIATQFDIVPRLLLCPTPLDKAHRIKSSTFVCKRTNTINTLLFNRARLSLDFIMG